MSQESAKHNEDEVVVVEALVVEIDEVAVAAAKMKADEDEAYMAKIMQGRQRGDYCDNFYGQMRMTSLESFYQRA